MTVAALEAGMHVLVEKPAAGCMRDQGLDWPDPAADGSKFAGSDVKIDKKSPEFQAAFEVCDEALAAEAAVE